MIKGFETFDPSLVFAAHHMNAWEEGKDIVFDVSATSWDSMETFFDIERMLSHTDTGKDRAGSLMRRVRLNLVTKDVQVTDWPNMLGIPLLNTVDFPMINPLYTGYKNRYAYGWVGIDYFKQHLVKKDLENSSMIKYGSFRVIIQERFSLFQIQVGLKEHINKLDDFISRCPF